MSGVQALDTTRTATILIFRWSSSGQVLFSDPASVDLILSESTCREDSNKPLSFMNNPARQIVSKFSFTFMEFYPSILQLKWLFVTTYKAIHSHCDFNQCCSMISLYFLCIKKSIFNVNSRQQTSRYLNIKNCFNKNLKVKCFFETSEKLVITKLVQYSLEILDSKFKIGNKTAKR